MVVYLSRILQTYNFLQFLNCGHKFKKARGEIYERRREQLELRNVLLRQARKCIGEKLYICIQVLESRVQDILQFISFMYCTV
jgi:hypothetical protein